MRRMDRTRISGIGWLVAVTSALGASEEWNPAEGVLTTRWTTSVRPESARDEYPRPQLVREDWACLNGLWDYAVLPKEQATPSAYEGKILVPFPIEAPLSGVKRRLGPDECLWYRRVISIPESWSGRRVLLHFGAVDWEASVYLDGAVLGTHRGGYDAFQLELPDAVVPGTEHELVVRVWDPTDAGSQPRGKQVRQPGGIWYTPSSGIWQPVWLEPVPTTRIRSVSIVPDVDASTFRLRPEVDGQHPGVRARARILTRSHRDLDEPLSYQPVVGGLDTELRLEVKEPRLWTPDEPWLYRIEVCLVDDAGHDLDRVLTYGGLRKISVGRATGGVPRILLNDRFVFQLGPLDQGFWPDGLYAAPSDAALRFDVELTKRYGFNMARKHVKVEPDRWYSWCDRLGLLVWQDMPSGGGPAPWPEDGVEIGRTPSSRKQYHRELEAMVRGLRNHPSIVAWTPFNEGWGQFETEETTARVRELDPTRLVIAASGGNDFGVGDAHDIHVYPGPATPPAESHRASVLGEFGGLGLAVRGHLYTERSWSYAVTRSSERLTERYVELMAKLEPLIASRLSAAVYTQTTDLEAEFNGIVTYDREVEKLQVEKAREAHRKLYEVAPDNSWRSTTAAATVASWRFESPTATDEGIAVVDASGQGNALVVPEGSRPSVRLISSESPGVVPATGAANSGLLDATAVVEEGQAGARGLVTRGADPAWGPIEGLCLSEWTVEASFRLVELRRFHGIVGKDGRPTDSPLAPLQLKVRGDDGRIQIEAIDQNGIAREVRSREPAEVDRWYHVAATSDGTTLRLHLDRGDGQGYQIEGSTPLDGALIRSRGLWSVGRGYFDGRCTDEARAWIDEVRVSAVALPVDAFLYSGSGAVPTDMPRLPGEARRGPAILGPTGTIPPESAEDRIIRHRRVAERRAGTPVLVHRGATRFAAENSLDAYRHAMDRGADGVEIDIRRTSDGVLYILHDDSLDRTTDGAGKAREKPYPELLRCSLGGSGIGGAKIPTLASVLVLARQRAMLLHLDVKEPGLQDEITRLLDEADVWDHLVEVNAGNAERIRTHPQVRLLAYKGWFPENVKDPNSDAVREFLSRPGDMVFVKWDPDIPVRALGRREVEPVPLPEEIEAPWPAPDRRNASVLGPAQE